MEVVCIGQGQQTGGTPTHLSGGCWSDSSHQSHPSTSWWLAERGQEWSPPAACAPPSLLACVLGGAQAVSMWQRGLLFFPTPFPVRQKAGLGSPMLQLLAAVVRRLRKEQGVELIYCMSLAQPPARPEPTSCGGPCRAGKLCSHPLAPVIRVAKTGLGSPDL